LFKRFGINYNNEKEIYKKGSVVFRQVNYTFLVRSVLANDEVQYQLEETKAGSESKTSQGQGEEESSALEKISKTQQEKIRKQRRKAQVVVEHVDIIKDEFWERRPWILSGKPGKLPKDA
jgi:tRNA(His) guanylyltransferase